MKDQIQPLQILLLEDDDADVKAVQRTFKKAKIANPIIRAVDGVEGLEILRGTNGREKLNMPYLVLVDLNMPRMGGIDFIRELRADEELKKTIVFILTTSKSQEDKAKAYDLNVAGYIVKEVAGQDFLRLVELVDAYWRIVELPD
ncbi:Response regulator receiver domain-containing protein [Reichenbachiella faecimaris]|uniref:Response regulator receiver domain-containing protein n=1 Tax=Reichenbachiella faecimaris TaxID=692418 RepID=A0A1W2GH89_REIFA|nr:response regulator [Reichenbachiella faecimaris]SMD36019.1 Response regulator receiver domain-containing protein [Reichenbachiella faecimaris]